MRLGLIKPVIAVAIAAALTGCLLSESVQTITGPTMGSTYTIKYVQSAGVPEPQALKAEVDAYLATFDQEVSTYRDDSAIERFNQAEAGTCQAMPQSVLDLVAYGHTLNEQSDGAFDLTLEPLLDLWGFGPRGQALRVPSTESLASTLARIGMQYLRIEGDQLCKDAAVQVDFNAIAAGYAVDRLTQLLQARGITHLMVEATGELKAIGHKPGGAPWRIGIEAPQADKRVAQRIIALDGYGVSTSGDYRNYFEENGHRYSHTLDPQTGAPITHSLAAVTVVTPLALHADGLSTLLMVLGPERGLAYAKQANLAALFVVRDGEGFASFTTPAFDALFPAQEEE